MELKPYIKEKRMEAHLTQKQLAEKIGMSKTHLSRLESGAHYPTTTILFQIANICGCKVDDLYKIIN